MDQEMNTIKSTLNDKEPEMVSDIGLDPEALERVSGGGLSPQEKEKWFKVMRNAMDNGCTKEEFLKKHCPRSGNSAFREFINNVWELTAVANIDVSRKRSHVE